MKILSVGLVASGLAAISGCSMNEFAVGTTAPVLREAGKNFAKENDVELARSAAPAQLKTVDGFLTASPKNKIMIDLCAKGYLEYAFGFVEDELEATPDDTKHAAQRQMLAARATDYYERAMGYALRLVDADLEHFSDTMKKDVNAVEAQLKTAKPKSIAGLFYTALALASSINLNRTDLTRVVELPKAVALLNRVYQLDPKFYNAGAAMTLGVLHSSQGKAMGGNPELAKKMFDEAIASTDGKYLLARVLMARFYAVSMQQGDADQAKQLFVKTLKDVLATPADVYPDYRLANELAKRRAARYLAHVEDYF